MWELRNEILNIKKKQEEQPTRRQDGTDPAGASGQPYGSERGN